MAKKMGVIPVKKGFQVLPDWLWCIILDVLDFLLGIPAAILTIIGVGLAVDLVMDFVFGLMSYFIFDDVEMWFYCGGLEMLMPEPFDMLPSYSGYYTYRLVRKLRR